MDQVGIEAFFSFLQRRLWLLVLGAIFAGGAAYGISRLQPPVYASTVMLAVEESPEAARDAYAVALAGNLAVKTYAEQIRSPSMLSNVGGKLGLSVSLQRLQAMIQVRPVLDTRLFRVTAEGATPESAALLANTLTELFIAQVREAREDRFRTALADIDARVAEVRERLTQTQAALAALSIQARGGASDFALSESARLGGVLATDQTLYTLLVSSREAMRLDAAKSAAVLSIASPGRPEPIPVRPKTLLNTMVAALLGFLAAVGFAWLLEFLDDTVKPGATGGTILELPTLAAIPRLKRREMERALEFGSSTRSVAGEAFRMLRTNLAFVGVSQPLRKLLVTSPNRNDGKTFVSVELGASLAQGGQSVVVVDVDLRKPSVHRLLGLPNSSGLTNALLDNDPVLDQYLQPTAIPSLRIMTAGPLPPNPADLLQSERMAMVVERLCAMADVVIMDTPPTLGIVDASVVSRLVDGVALVILPGKTRTKDAQFAVEQIRRSGTRLVGAILNKVARSGRSSYYYPYYYYYTYSTDGAQEGTERRRRRRRSST